MLVEQEWPEGSNADPDAARDRYNTDMQASRRSMRNLFRVELPIAHMGLAITIIASVFAGVVWSPRTGVIISGAFAALFVAALAVALLAGSRGRNAVRAAYRFTFGWADWITPWRRAPSVSDRPGNHGEQRCPTVNAHDDGP
ncbi:hypothetical protein AB0H92_07325 [Streptomyces phaeochromogenes]|uniref:hypothetical protein n=1 Tax=Streptomyces phaeochromogenes TaxID=1923 RepID=UPI0033E1653B